MLRPEKTALIRCDGGPGIGLGHVTRCLAIAEALTSEGWSCRFAVSAATRDLAPLAGSPFEVMTLTDAMSPGDLKKAAGKNVDLLLIDHYGLDAGYEVACRDIARALMVIDDAPLRPHRCDILLDASADRQATDYAALLPDHCMILLGAAYVPLRGAFTMMRDRSLARRNKSSAVERLFISFGGVDGQGLCDVALSSLEAIDACLSVDVVIGGASQHLARLKTRAAASHHNVMVHVDSSHVPELLTAADIALGAAGINAWERCALGVPSIFVVVADNQRATYEALAESGAAVAIGGLDEGLPARLLEALAALIEDDEWRETVARKSAALCDGHGASRIAGAINAWMKKERANAAV